MVERIKGGHLGSGKAEEMTQHHFFSFTIEMEAVVESATCCCILLGERANFMRVYAWIDTLGGTRGMVGS